MINIKKFSETNKTDVSSTFSLQDYAHGDTEADIVIATIHGRYPETGFVKNLKSKEVIYILEGNGTLHMGNEEIKIEKGDALIIDPNEKFAWSGDFKLVSVCTPALTSDGEEFVD